MKEIPTRFTKYVALYEGFTGWIDPELKAYVSLGYPDDAVFTLADRKSLHRIIQVDMWDKEDEAEIIRILQELNP